MPPYPAYRPSGVEWLGDVPEHWEVKPLDALGERLVRTNEAVNWTPFRLPGSFDPDIDEEGIPETFRSDTWPTCSLLETS